MDVSLIEPLRTALLAQGPLSALATHVWERTTALDTRGSNAIEGNTLTIREPLMRSEREVGGISPKEPSWNTLTR